MTQSTYAYRGRGHIPYVTLTLQCDRCSNSQKIIFREPETETDAEMIDIRVAMDVTRKSAGWKRVYGFDICPECQETEETDDV